MNISSFLHFRCLYSNSKFNGVVERKVKSIIEDSEYACEGSFIDDKSYLQQFVVVRRQLTCILLVKTAYYSSKLPLPAICFYCGNS